jgi:hypothetical protein
MLGGQAPWPHDVSQRAAKASRSSNRIGNAGRMAVILTRDVFKEVLSSRTFPGLTKTLQATIRLKHSPNA